MNKIIFKSLVAFTFVITQLHAQTSFWNGPDAYLGQTQPGDIPIKFAPGLLADSPNFSANKVAFSSDGKEFYYCYNKTWENSDYLKMKCFKYENGKWNGPFLINEHFNAPALSVDGKSLYFNDNQYCNYKGTHQIHQLIVSYFYPPAPVEGYGGNQKW